MANLEELTSKYQTIQKTIQQAKDLKARLEERKSNTEKQLKGLVDKVRAAGFDIKNLKEIRDEKVAELEKLVKEKEVEVKEVLTKLKEIDLETSL